ncbi:MAG: 30S ribosome-binding factor RbfA [Acidobacteria bacterium]|nr:30S ribosome-binding factor RbfA [Acidobacteriota bacterium]
MDPHRGEKIAEALREELREIITFEMGDPRLSGVEVTHVLLAPGGRLARVLVALGGGEGEQRESLAALEHARRYLRQEVARRLNLRRAPELLFEADRWLHLPDRVDLLLKRAKKNPLIP